MLDGWSPGWKVYLRPLAVATAFTVAGEAMIFAYWGLFLHPEGDVLTKLFWTAACGIGMGAATGLLVGFVVGARYRGTVAANLSAFCYVIVLAAGILISYEADAVANLFRVRQYPFHFLMTGVVPTLLTAPLFGWLLHSTRGKRILKRVGL
jgi:hypothetical protein